jgi:hypothetical protein
MKPPRSPSLLLAALALVGCGEPDLEVQGITDRVVGETVTLSLVEGESGFSGSVELRDAKGTSFPENGLRVNTVDERKLSFVIPTGIAAGPARAMVGRKDDGTYDVPLKINRLALALNDQGAVEVLPLPPATLTPSSLPGVSATGGHIALAATGGEVAVLGQDQASRFALGQTPKAVGTGVEQKGGRALATVPDGLLLCSDTAVILLKFVQGKVTQTTTNVSGCRAIAADSQGTRAVVLSTCSIGSDPTLKDCLTELDIGTSITVGTPISLDDAPSAMLVRITADGKGAVVADQSVVYGVWLDNSTPPTAETLGMMANVVDLARGPSSVGDLFAVADADGKRVVYFGFDNASFKKLTAESPLPEAPVALAFGRQSELYVAVGKKLYALDAEHPQVEASLLNVSAAGAIRSLVVQP